MTLVKICGITNLDDAHQAVEYGADILGFNFYSSSPRYIAPGTAKHIDERIRAKAAVKTVGVFVNEQLDRVLETAILANIDFIQLHGDESPNYVENVRDNSGLGIIKAFRVNEQLRIADLKEYPLTSELYDEMSGILLDAYSPSVYGGSGLVVDWEFAMAAANDLFRVYLAGGLNPENVRQAIERVRPFAVDVASGVESSPGKKDPKKVAAFIRAAKEAI